MTGSGDLTSSSLVRVHFPAAVLGDAARLHEELACRLGLPPWYGRNLDALLDCLSSIGDPDGGLCAPLRSHPGDGLVIGLDGFSLADVNAKLLIAFLQIVADANERLARSGRPNRIWIELSTAHQDGGERPAH